MTVIMLFNSTIADNLHRFVVFNSSLETALFERLFFLNQFIGFQCHSLSFGVKKQSLKVKPKSHKF